LIRPTVPILSHEAIDSNIKGGGMIPGSLSIDDSFSELKNSLSSLGDKNHESLLRLLSDEFIAMHPDDRIRILADCRLTGEAEAGFLLQIDDYDVRLELLEAPAGDPILPTDRLAQVIAFLENNPNTVAAVLIWTTRDLPAVCLSVDRARAAAQDTGVLSVVLSEAQPLIDVLNGIVRRQLAVWEADLATAVPCLNGQALDTQRAFERAIVQAIETERHRTYRNPTRKQAALQFPVEEETKAILETLERALAGERAPELVAHLTRMSRRGLR
jgi:hypothetical protein